MKTFDEAVALVIPHISRYAESSIVEAAERIITERERLEQIRKEACESPAVQSLLYQAVAWVAEDDHTVHQSLFTVFMYGLQIGMEMEKHE